MKKIIHDDTDCTGRDLEDSKHTKAREETDLYKTSLLRVLMSSWSRQRALPDRR